MSANLALQPISRGDMLTEMARFAADELTVPKADNDNHIALANKADAAGAPGLEVEPGLPPHVAETAMNDKINRRLAQDRDKKREALKMVHLHRPTSKKAKAALEEPHADA